MDGTPILNRTLVLVPIQWYITTKIIQNQVQELTPPNCPHDKTFILWRIRDKLLHIVHLNPSYGHPGIAGTLQLLQNHYCWPTMQADTTKSIQGCTICNMNKPSHQWPAGLLQLLAILHWPWSNIAVDFITNLPLSQGNTTILKKIFLSLQTNTSSQTFLCHGNC